MWSNVISIDKSYDKEINYILKKLQSTKDVSSAIEESRGRMWVYLASACESQDAVECDINELIQDVFLTFIKLRFFWDKLNFRTFNHAKCALLSSLVHFDRGFESNIVMKAVSNTLDYNVDGILNFRLRALKESWSEVAEVANRLLDNSMSDNDIYDIAGFITGSDGKMSQLAITKNGIYSITKRRYVDEIDVFGNKEYNAIFSIVSQNPAEILIEDKSLSAQMINCLKHLARVVEK